MRVFLQGYVFVKVLSTCLACEMIFENLVFLRGQKTPPVLLEKYAEIGKFLYLQIVLKSWQTRT